MRDLHLRAVFVVALTSVLALAACKSAAPAPTETTTPVVVLRGSKGATRVTVELARTEEERAHGLMFRKELAPDRGMLFLFDEARVHKFWMKNTVIPLDMIFIAEDLHVVGVDANAEPLTLSARGPDDACRYVLEVQGGWAEGHGVATGTTVEFSGFRY